MADHGRAAVAAVEEAAFGGTSADEPRSRAELYALIEDVIGAAWWRSCGTAVAVRTPRSDARSSSARSCGDGVELRLADAQLTVATVVHELAHALAGVEHGHGPLLRAAHVDVTAVVAGAQASVVLASRYRDFQLTVAARAWPVPFRAAGDTFLVITA